MRIIPANMQASIADLQNFTYCFYIKLADSTELYLTESDRSLLIDGKMFVPHSGVTMQEGVFNDSAKNYIILEGIFETGGVQQHMDLTSAEVKIYVCFTNICNHFITYSCSNFTKRDLGFVLRLEPFVKAYDQIPLQFFSKNCRANFGDLRCKVDKRAYSKEYKIKEIFAKTIILATNDKESGYFTGGDASMGEGQFDSKILQHSNDFIILDRLIPETVKHIETVELVAGCDKKFITCCNKFNNAVNFRGEPLIPDEKFIKVI